MANIRFICLGGFDTQFWVVVELWKNGVYIMIYLFFNVIYNIKSFLPN